MLKSSRRIIFCSSCLLLLIVAVAYPPRIFKGLPINSFSIFKGPFLLISSGADFIKNLFQFRSILEQNKSLRKTLSNVRFNQIQFEELIQENRRLIRLLELKKSLPVSVHRKVASRVIARSPLKWNQVLYIDKGREQGVETGMLVLAENVLIGKVIEAGASMSKVLLVTDSNFRIGVLLEKTRQAGVLFGNSMGECRVKYLSLDGEIKSGQTVFSAGFGGYYKKGLVVGVVAGVWKEPGQIYRVAKVVPYTDLSKVEEVICVE